MSDIILTHEDTKKLLDKPYIVLSESADGELRINGESVCWHKSLSPFDVLNALKEYGIINFTYIKE